MNVKGVKRSVKVWATNLECFQKHFVINKLQAVKNSFITYIVIHRMVSFERYCIDNDIRSDIQGGPERSRQSNLAMFTVEGGLDSKFPCVK